MLHRVQKRMYTMPYPVQIPTEVDRKDTDFTFQPGRYQLAIFIPDHSFKQFANQWEEEGLETQ